MAEETRAGAGSSVVETLPLVTFQYLAFISLLFSLKKASLVLPITAGVHFLFPFFASTYPLFSPLFWRPAATVWPHGILPRQDLYQRAPPRRQSRQRPALHWPTYRPG